MLVICRLRPPNSESYNSPIPESLIQSYILTEPKVSRIGVEVVELFCLFLTGAIAKMLFTQSYSRNTSETMWSAGSSGQGR